MPGNIPEQSSTAGATQAFNIAARSVSPVPESPVMLPEWLDRHPRLPYLVLALVPFLIILPLWILRLSPDPIWFFSNAVQNVKAGLMPGGLPFGDPNVGWTSEALGRLAASQWVHGKVPWWNPYSGIGMPLAGEMQPGAFFLPFVLLLLLHNGFVWLRVAMQLVAGFSTFALLRELKLGRLAALVGGVLFELNGTFAWTPGPISVFCAAAFMPLVLLGIEQISNRKQTRTGTLWVALGIAFSIVAGFPETAYIDGLLILLWSICRFATLPGRWRFALRVMWAGALGILLTAPLIAGFWSLTQASPAFKIHELGHNALPIVALPTIFLPYAYGGFPESHGSALLSTIWGNVGGYAGLLLFFFALLGLRAKRPAWLRFLLIGWVALAWAKTFGVEPVMSLMNHLPFLLQTAFYRYADPSWQLCLIILAALAMEEWRYRRLRIGVAGWVSLAILALSICIALPTNPVWGWSAGQAAKLAKYLTCAAAWALGGFVVAALLLSNSRTERRRCTLGAILALDAAAFFTVPLLSSAHAGQVDRSALRFLHQHLGLARFHSLQPVEPNYSAYFDLAAINYDVFPVPSKLVSYVSNRLFPPVAKSNGSIWWPAWEPYGSDAGPHYLLKFLRNYEELGVRYVVTNPTGANAFRLAVALPTAQAGNEPLALQPNQQTRFSVPAPVSPEDSTGSIASINLFIGNYGNNADGSLAVKVCTAGHCATGSRPLAESSDNTFFSVPINPDLRAAPGAALEVTVTHNGGSKPVALWLWPDLPGQNQNLFGPDGKLMPGRAVRLSFNYDIRSGGLPRVYHDSLMDIFELPHPAPYYSIEQGGPCRLDSTNRDSIHASCVAPALLIRRELFMPGWYASVAGKRLEAKPYRDIFQSFDLPQGDSYLRFDYAPPLARPAAYASFFAGLALLGELAFAFLRSRVRRAVQVAMNS